MSQYNYKALIEAILFVWSEPIHIDEISKIIELNKKETRQYINELILDYSEDKHGIMLNNYDDYLQFSTKAQYDSYISKLVKSSKKKQLSNSAMEVLALIAYKQPITRVEIDDVRGVKSYSSIETLMNKGLIEEAGRLDKIGRPILYRTTTNFLAAFNINSLNDLPKVDQLDFLDQEEEDIKDDENK